MTRRPSIPRGHSWARSAAQYVDGALFWTKVSSRGAEPRVDRSLKRSCLRKALAVVYAHSRSPDTRLEAKRLLQIVETMR